MGPREPKPGLQGQRRARHARPRHRHERGQHEFPDRPRRQGRFRFRRQLRLRVRSLPACRRPVEAARRATGRATVCAVRLCARRAKHLRVVEQGRWSSGVDPGKPEWRRSQDPRPGRFREHRRPAMDGAAAPTVRGHHRKRHPPTDFHRCQPARRPALPGAGKKLPGRVRRFHQLQRRRQQAAVLRFQRPRSGRLVPVRRQNAQREQTAGGRTVDQTRRHGRASPDPLQGRRRRGTGWIPDHPAPPRPGQPANGAGSARRPARRFLPAAAISCCR